jgi:hypothetical protein
MTTVCLFEIFILRVHMTHSPNPEWSVVWSRTELFSGYLVKLLQLRAVWTDVQEMTIREDTRRRRSWPAFLVYNYVNEPLRRFHKNNSINIFNDIKWCWVNESHHRPWSLYWEEHLQNKILNVYSEHFRGAFAYIYCDWLKFPSLISRIWGPYAVTTNYLQEAMSLRSHQSLSYSRTSKFFMGPQRSLRCSQEPSTGTYPAVHTTPSYFWDPLYCILQPRY